MGICWVQTFNIKDVLVARRRRLKKSSVLGIWKLVPLAIWWCTWKEMNQHNFLRESFIASQFQTLFFENDE